MSDNIIANGVVYGSEVATAAKDVSYTGIDNVTNVEEALDYLRDDLADKADAASLSTVASTGNYNDLQNTPSIPSKVSDLINDNSYVQANTNSLEHYYTKDKLYTKEEVEELVNTTNDIYKVVTTLPTENISKSVIYLVRKSTDEEGDLYQKAVYVNNKWEYFKEGGNAEIYYDQDVETSKVSNNTAPSTKAVYDYIQTLGLDDAILDHIDITSPNAVNSEAVSDYVEGQIDDLASVAKSGKYSDLEDKPVIPPAVTIASLDKAGIIKPDGISVTVSADGVLSSSSGVPATDTTLGTIKIDARYFSMTNDNVMELDVADLVDDTNFNISTDKKIELDVNSFIDNEYFEINDDGKITIVEGSIGAPVEWTQLTTEGTHIADIKINGETTEIYAPEGGGGGGSSIRYYSDEEQIIGQWYDGRPVYESIITEINTSSLPNIYLADYISYIDFLIDARVSLWKSGDYGRKNKAFFSSCQYANGMSLEGNTLTLNFESDNDYSIDKIFLQYVKSTDTPTNEELQVVTAEGTNVSKVYSNWYAFPDQWGGTLEEQDYYNIIGGEGISKTQGQIAACLPSGASSGTVGTLKAYLSNYPKINKIKISYLIDDSYLNDDPVKRIITVYGYNYYSLQKEKIYEFKNISTPSSQTYGILTALIDVPEEHNRFTNLEFVISNPENQRVGNIGVHYIKIYGQQFYD